MNRNGNDIVFTKPKSDGFVNIDGDIIVYRMLGDRVVVDGNLVCYKDNLPVTTKMGDDTFIKAQHLLTEAVGSGIPVERSYLG